MSDVIHKGNNLIRHKIDTISKEDSSMRLRPLQAPVQVQSIQKEQLGIVNTLSDPVSKL